jgi:hemerythrin-like domain-containing protein
LSELIAIANNQLSELRKPIPINQKNKWCTRGAMAREAKKVSERACKVLRDVVANHVAQLKKVKRKLTKEEVEFLEQFKQKLEEAEEVITKEAQDISRS